MRKTAACLVLGLAVVGGAGSGAAVQESPEPENAAAIYAALRDVGFDAAAALRVAGIEFTRGPATFVLEDGHWIPLQPVGGRVTGAVFIGEGRVFYEPPPGVERDQLEKFTDEQTLEEEFERLYLRFSDATADFVAATPQEPDGPAGSPEALPYPGNVPYLEDAAELHDEVRDYFLEGASNLDARVLVDLIDQRDGLFAAWIDTREDGPLYFSQNPMGEDLFRLNGFSRRADGFDVWGGFGAPEEPAARPIHYNLDMTLDGETLEEGRAELELQATAPGRRVLRFDAHPLVEMREVLDAAGEPLFYVREPSKDDASEGQVTVVFPEPLSVETPTRITFVFGGDIVDKLGTGGEYAIKVPDGWFPTIGYLQRATFDMTFRVDDGDKVFASAERVSDEVVDGVRIARFKQELPVAFVSFNYGNMSTREVTVEGAPPITVFGYASGIGGDALGNVGVDVGNSLVMFSEMFGSYPFSYMAATRIPFGHGQGFPGLLHLAAGSFGSEVPGHTEVFRGHETSHQWWGHIVSWKTYRDQWISEGFAEYSGALYATAYLDDPELLDKMTEAWRNDLFKRGNAGFRSFGTAPGTVQRRSEGTWSGPVTLGMRLSSSETPVDYAMLAYEKGAYILHMLRMLMHDWPTGSDEAFFTMMRDFVASHAGGAASTESFRAVVEKHFRADMGWFFDQWVYGTSVPTYRYAWRAKTAIDGSRTLELRIRQTVVPARPFTMPVPVRVELGNDRFVVLKVPVDESVEYYNFDLPIGIDPQEVILNPMNAVLAEVTKEDWR